MFKSSTSSVIPVTFCFVEKKRLYFYNLFWSMFIFCFFPLSGTLNWTDFWSGDWKFCFCLFEFEEGFEFSWVLRPCGFWSLPQHIRFGMNELFWIVQLFASIVPRTAENFRALCTGISKLFKQTLSYHHYHFLIVRLLPGKHALPM